MDLPGVRRCEGQKTDFGLSWILEGVNAMSVEHASEEKKNRIKRQVETTQKEENKTRPAGDSHDTEQVVSALQSMVGNRAVQRLLAQRSSEEPYELDNETESRINSQRGGGQQLNEGMQKKMGTGTGHDFSNVRVHTSPEADGLNRQLGAKAFTTGNDIFFRQGQYDPNSSGGQELLAHEMTHVVQQSAGLSGSGSGMTVNAPGDVYEQEADTVASSVMQTKDEGVIQRDPIAEDEEEVQMQETQEEELQMQEMPEEEELMMQEEEEELQMQETEEEELMMQEIPEEEEEIAALEEEEELQTKRGS
jgi:hypothetical protein